MPKNAFAWDQPFDEAVNFFLAKTAMPRAEFDKLAAAEKVKSFTAAYVYKADELQRVYDACLAALAKGQTLNDFRKATADILTKPWHRETVFRTNVLSAYGAGHWQQAQAAKGSRPYARYSAVMDGRTRPRHAALHGLVYPLDHPFWKLYWPPWDYNCRCAAITLSQGEIDKEGLKVSQDLPQTPGPRNNFASPAAGDWDPDLSKYAEELREKLQDALRGSKGTEMEGAPLGVKNRQEMVQTIKERLGSLTNSGINDIEFGSFPGFMATDSQGNIRISTRKLANLDDFAPAQDLLSAFKKLGRAPLSFNEEYSLESLWHEINHNRQIFAGWIVDEWHPAKVLLEVITQWYSRQTYPEMLEKLGNFKPLHYDAIKSGGHGYSLEVGNFNRLLASLRLTDKDLFPEIKRIFHEVDRNFYTEPLARMLAQKAGIPERWEAIADAVFNLHYDRFDEILGSL